MKSKCNKECEHSNIDKTIEQKEEEEKKQIEKEELLRYF